MIPPAVAAAVARAVRAVAGLLGDAADAVFDTQCAAGEHALGATFGPACSRCLAQLAGEAEPQRCPSCSAPVRRPGSCGACASRPRRVAVHAPRPHRGVARSLVLALKASRREEVARVLAAAGAADAAVAAAVRACDVVVPIPGDPVRRRERGFDHAECLARELVACATPRRGRRPRVVTALAVRAGERKQSTRSAAERRRALRRTMRLRPLASRSIAGRRVLLVDDVVTTGATVAEAARVLLAAGAASVEAVACTRAQGPILDAPAPRRSS